MKTPKCNALFSLLLYLRLKGKEEGRGRWKKEDRTRRSGSVVKSTGYSVRRPTFDTQHPKAG